MRNKSKYTHSVHYLYSRPSPNSCLNPSPAFDSSMALVFEPSTSTGVDCLPGFSPLNSTAPLFMHMFLSTICVEVYPPAADFRCRIQKYPSAPSTTMVPMPAPTPIPAISPPDRPLDSSVDGVLLGVAVAGVDKDDADATAASTGAMVTADIVPQQSSLSPQHHTVEFSVPSQGVIGGVAPVSCTSSSCHVNPRKLRTLSVRIARFTETYTSKARV